MTKIHREHRVPRAAPGPAPLQETPPPAVKHAPRARKPDIFQDAAAPSRGRLPEPRLPVASRLVAGGPSGTSLDIRLGRVDAPPRLPAWYPADFNLQAAAAGAKDILTAQGLPPEAFARGATQKLLLSDADFTLLQTNTPIFLKHKGTGERLLDPGTGQPVALRESPGKYLPSLMQEARAQQPSVNWDDYAPDFTELGSADELVKQRPIMPSVDALKQSDAGTRDFIVTARSDAAIPGALRDTLQSHGAQLDGVFVVNNVDHAAKLGIPQGLHTEGKKALAMAALLQLFGPEAAAVRHVTFMDDSDANLVAAMTTLPKLFPDVAFEFVDVVHTGARNFELRVVAKSGDKGQLQDASGKALSAEQLETYRSDDHPLDVMAE